MNLINKKFANRLHQVGYAIGFIFSNQDPKSTMFTSYVYHKHLCNVFDFLVRQGYDLPVSGYLLVSYTNKNIYAKFKEIIN